MITITATASFDSDLVPSTDGARDLGASSLEFKDLHRWNSNIDTLDVDGFCLHFGTGLMFITHKQLVVSCC